MSVVNLVLLCSKHTISALWSRQPAPLLCPISGWKVPEERWRVFSSSFYSTAASGRLPVRFCHPPSAASCLPTPACSASASFSAIQWAPTTHPPESSEPQLQWRGRALSKFILPWVFSVISGGRGCSLSPLFLYPLGFLLPHLVNSSLYWIFPVQITASWVDSGWILIISFTCHMRTKSFKKYGEQGGRSVKKNNTQCLPCARQCLRTQ